MTSQAKEFRLPGALQMLSWVGLAASLMTLALSAPHLIEEGGGLAMFLGNIARYTWTLTLLLLVFAQTRTLGARALVGAALAGFFGVASLAVMLGKPFVDWLGPQSLFVMSIFAPISEELLKVMPVAVFLLLAMRSPRFRPSVADAVLFGMTVASGFSVYENILYARVTGGWLDTLPFSPVLPFLSTQGSMLVGGHVVYTGLASLGLAVTIIYRKRFRLARYALPVGLAIAILEHMLVDRLVILDPSEQPALWVRLGLVITLWGYLSTLLLIGGIAVVTIYETRVMKRGGATLPASRSLGDSLADLKRSRTWAGLVQLHKRSRYESLRRSTILAAAQTGEHEPDARATAAVQRMYLTTNIPAGAAI